jgi:hypothetical protein
MRCRLAIQSLQNKLLKEDGSLPRGDDSTSTSSTDDDDTPLGDADPVLMDDDILSDVHQQPDLHQDGNDDSDDDEVDSLILSDFEANDDYDDDISLLGFEDDPMLMAEVKENAAKTLLRLLDPYHAVGVAGCDTPDLVEERFGHMLPADWRKQYSIAIGQLYTEKDQGKGEHDGDSAVLKRVIFNGELLMRRSPDAEGILKTATRQLGQKKGLEHTFPQLKEWERTGDPRL